MTILTTDLSPEAQVEWDRTVASLGTWDVTFERDGLAQHVRCSGGEGCLCYRWTGKVWIAEKHTEVQALAEVYRRRLKLKTWAEHREWAAKVVHASYMDPLRRSGRTTRALLEHLAHCTAARISLLIVCGGSDVMTQHCAHEARCMSKALRLNIRVNTRWDDYPDRPGQVTYRDHYLIEKLVRHNRKSGF